ncbi:EGF domain-specific O-linked N-acetylglucosamine transferase [Chrysoperla carnea]|uniref:EGF domain-specific O-linked N-acetylglucosamine transferase n=1 Tax=Chrysoperla carnea TaxID=189513 RepID=UPI001D090508|nr:EGF domain-specific O-linked N-acetylglucosamine transferase [Chrysoperla carnea]
MNMNKFFIICVLIFLNKLSVADENDYTQINIPDEHLPLYFNQFPKIAEKCEEDPHCPYKHHLNSNKCWGYENNCNLSTQYSIPHCPGDHQGWVKTKEDQIKTFYTQGDFGYVKQYADSMMIMCEPLFPDDSSLECSEHLSFCRGRNLMINFTKLWKRNELVRYKMDVLGDGDIGGFCTLHKERLMKQADHISPLQSWGPEFRYFKKLPRKPIIEGDCDLIVEKPTFIMKIDATLNMYHHFCDFFNLYASLHLNSTYPEMFSTDVQILIWETYKYESSFKDTFKAFTKHPIWDLYTFRNKKANTVCFRNVIFPLLPRMIFGLFYNTPLISGCEKSGLFHAFSKHILHRLQIPLQKRSNSKIRVTLLSRDSRFRNILNENELIAALKKNKNYDVKRVKYSGTQNKYIRDFRQQLNHTRNSDIFIGMHGAGLTHLLFLPDWAVVFELYNCEDPNCYLDLARLRGIKYITWENKTVLHQQDEGQHPDGGPHAKFTNYSFNVKEFVRLVDKAAKHVKEHPKWQEFIQNINNTNHDEL